MKKTYDFIYLFFEQMKHGDVRMRIVWLVQITWTSVVPLPPPADGACWNLTPLPLHSICFATSGITFIWDRCIFSGSYTPWERHCSCFQQGKYSFNMFKSSTINIPRETFLPIWWLQSWISISVWASYCCTIQVPGHVKISVLLSSADMTKNVKIILSQ